MGQTKSAKTEHWFNLVNSVYLNSSNPPSACLARVDMINDFLDKIE